MKNDANLKSKKKLKRVMSYIEILVAHSIQKMSKSAITKIKKQGLSQIPPS
jgi:hypothetical protein